MNNASPLLSLIPDNLSERLVMLSSDPKLLTPLENRAVKLRALLMQRRRKQVGARLRDIASTGRYWTEELAQKPAQYWTDSASLMPGLCAKELRAEYLRRIAAMPTYFIEDV